MDEFINDEPLKAVRISPGQYIHLNEDQVEEVKGYMDIDKISNTEYLNYLVIDVYK